jgi:amidophosphoribosyltransferase
MTRRFAPCPASIACGHVRYSTTGETSLRNVQPLYAELSSGGFAVAHNGNISNAMKLRRELIRRGSIFQSTSDTEVIIHLVATSSYRTLLDRFIDALKQVEGAYSLICMTAEGMIACRDPLGIRPLVMGRLGDAVIFASETVAFDVVGAEYVRQVEPGELIVVPHIAGAIRCAATARSATRIRARAFSSMSIFLAPTRSSTAAASIRCARRSARSWRSRIRSRRIM